MYIYYIDIFNCKFTSELNIMWTLSIATLCIVYTVHCTMYFVL